MTAPVVLFLYNRSDTLQAVFARIRSLSPPRLYLIADGPHADVADDAARCAAARAVVAEVDWPCRVERVFAPANLGCTARIRTGLDHVFSREDRAIVLEDDVLPSPAFLEFCTDLLEQHAENLQVQMISGRNELGSWRPGEGSYFAAHTGSIWGWATWRRSWHAHRAELLASSRAEVAQRIASQIVDTEYVAHLLASFDALTKGTCDTWDNTWTLAGAYRNQMALVPTHNLCANIGFGALATHSKRTDDIRADLSGGTLGAPFTSADRPLTPDEGYERRAFLVRAMATWRSLSTLHLLAKAARDRPELLPQGDAYTLLAPLRAPDEAIAVLDHILAAEPSAPNTARLRSELARLRAAA